MATKWPDEVPVLVAGDIHKGWFNGPGDTHCLAGWWREICDEPSDSYSPSDVDEAIVEAARELGAREADYKWGQSVSYINDGNPKPLVARIWNRAMAKLGYVVNNPEAKYLKKKRSV